LASITKYFIAVLTYKLIEEGTINLDSKVSEYFPDYGNADKNTIRPFAQSQQRDQRFTDAP